MCGITAEIMNENTATVVQQNRLRWNGHVFGKDDEDWLNKVNFETDQGVKQRGRPRKICKEVVDKDMLDLELKPSDGMNCS